MPQRRRGGITFLLLAGSLAPFWLSSAQVPETLIGEGHLRAFLDETHYTPGAAGVSGDGGQVDRQAFESKDCRVVMDRPALGYQVRRMHTCVRTPSKHDTLQPLVSSLTTR